MLRDTEDAVIISTRAHADHRSDVEEEMRLKYTDGYPPCFMRRSRKGFDDVEFANVADPQWTSAAA